MTEEEKLKEREDFLLAAKPLIKWIAENASSPHVYAIVTSNEANLLESQIFVGTDEFLVD